MKATIQSLEKAGVPFVVYDKVRIEPTDVSIMDSIKFVRKHRPDTFIAVGGGSVIDTAKAANLYLAHPKADFLDFVNAPIGKGQVPYNSVFPLIAVPTTAGTGSETTGVSIFDYTPKKFKTGIASRLLKPYLGIVDPHNTRSMPPQVHVSTGLDVLWYININQVIRWNHTLQFRITNDLLDQLTQLIDLHIKDPILFLIFGH